MNDLNVTRILYCNMVVFMSLFSLDGYIL